jgi:group I intron endonuclease
MTHYYVYTISNTNNEKIYIGVTNNPTRRWREHLYKSDKVGISKLYAAMKKYGKSTFRMDIIYCTDDREHNFDMEVKFIHDLRTIDDGYNIDAGGKGGSTYRSEETKEKISISNTGRTHTKESKDAMSIARSGENNHMYGVKRPKEFCENMSKRLKGVPTGRAMTQESKERLGAINSIRMSTPEEKARISELGKKNKGRKMPPRTQEYKDDASKRYKGKTRPQVTCPHCGLVGGVGSMHQWHFDKCKLRPPFPIDDIN